MQLTQLSPNLAWMPQRILGQAFDYALSWNYQPLTHLLARSLLVSFNKIWSLLSGYTPPLLDLAAVQPSSTAGAYYYVGRQIVPLNQIQGSASPARCNDFDANFRPLKDHLQDRWQSITAARQRGVKLPPVALIQVGGLYFVEDGHHRISVAKTRGERDIEAEITVWQMAGMVS